MISSLEYSSQGSALLTGERCLEKLLIQSQNKEKPPFWRLAIYEI